MREDVKAKQDVFLEIFGRVGTIRGAIRVLNGVTGRRTVYDWIANDLYGFRERFLHAQHEFREYLQDVALERLQNSQGNRGSDGLLSHMLNANWPEKFRADAKPVDDSALVVARQTRDAIRALATAELVARGETGRERRERGEREAREVTEDSEEARDA